jgi:hypothetical protein
MRHRSNSGLGVVVAVVSVLTLVLGGGWLWGSIATFVVGLGLQAAFGFMVTLGLFMLSVYLLAVAAIFVGAALVMAFGLVLAWAS